MNPVIKNRHLNNLSFIYWAMLKQKDSIRLYRTHDDGIEFITTSKFTAQACVKLYFSTCQDP